jgi:hypothetical protein
MAIGRHRGRVLQLTRFSDLQGVRILLRDEPVIVFDEVHSRIVRLLRTLTADGGLSPPPSGRGPAGF